MRINLPNQVTLARLGLAIVFVALLSCFNATRLDQQRWLLNLCFWVFLAAALMDVVDGQLARWLHSVTSFGRIVDPVADKVMICSAFLLFASHPFWNEQEHVNITGVAPWMVVVILTREFLVSAVRTHVEAEGREFGALWMGKLKMFIQSATVCVVLGQLAWKLDHLAWLRIASVWTAVIFTALSAISYVHRARALLLSSAALGGARRTLGAHAVSGGAPDSRSARGPAAEEPAHSGTVATSVGAGSPGDRA